MNHVQNNLALADMSCVDYYYYYFNACPRWIICKENT